MATVVAARVKLVQGLRRLAATCDVARVKDSASKEKVKEMVDQLLTAELSVADKASLAKNWQSYRETWPEWMEDRRPALLAF